MRKKKKKKTKFPNSKLLLKTKMYKNGNYNKQRYKDPPVVDPTNKLEVSHRIDQLIIISLLEHLKHQIKQIILIVVANNYLLNNNNHNNNNNSNNNN